MEFVEEIKRPSKQERKTAMESYDALASMLEKLQTKNLENEIEGKTEAIINKYYEIRR